jgi:glycosyltransferase involved in cell wall biosynthesis
MKVSIITINRNNLRGLRNTMKSVLMQDSSQIEWIIIDGASTDGSVDLIKENEDKVAYWVSEPDSGIYEAMNKGTAAATGDYLQYLNSGDCLAAPDIISSFLALNPTADVVHGNTIIVNRQGEKVGEFIAPELVRLSFFWSHALNHQGTFFHRRCFERFRYNEANRIASDTELYMQLLYHGYTFEKWDRFVERFELGGLSSLENEDEFGDIVNRLLPPGIKADYDEIIQNRDVDLYILIRRIIGSKRWVRNAARLALLPFRLFLK